MRTSALLRVLGVAVASFVFFSPAVLAQTYPQQRIRLITPFAPGGATDLLSRIISEKVQLGQPVIVDNRPGAAGMNGTELVARAPPDGYTLANVISAHSVQQYLYKKVPYHYLKDFEPVILYARAALVFAVHPSVPANTVQEFVRYTKTSKVPMSYGSSGIGTAVHLGTEMFKQAAGIKMDHIPYKGGGPAVQEVLGGHVPAVALGLSTVAPHIQSGKSRALFVFSAKRQREFPNVPTLQESGFPGLVADEWWAILAPAGTPKAVVDRLNAEITRIFTLPDVQERIGRLGIEFIGSTPAGLSEFMQSESVRWGKVTQASGIKPE